MVLFSNTLVLAVPDNYTTWGSARFIEIFPFDFLVHVFFFFFFDNQRESHLPSLITIIFVQNFHKAEFHMTFIIRN